MIHSPPGALGGPALAILAGSRQDTHLLTAFAWHWAASRLDYNVTFVFICNAVVLALAALVLGLVVFRIQHKIWLSALAAGLFAFSPLSASLVVDPLGSESLAGLILALLLAGDLLGAYELPAFLRLVVPIVTVLQTPEFAPFALVYATCLTVRRRALGLAVLTFTLGIIALRFFSSASEWLHVRLASAGGVSFAITVIAIAIACFVLGPLALTLRNAISSRITIRVGRSSLAFLLALSALVGGFALTVDPSAALLSAEACIMLALAALPVSARARGASFALVALVTILSFAPVAGALPSIVIGRESRDMSTLLREAGSARVCVVGSTPSDDSIFAGGDLVRLSGAHAHVEIQPAVSSCLNPTRATMPFAIVVVGDRNVVSAWGKGSMPLAEAAMVATEPGTIPVPVADGKSEPYAAKAGAFSRTVDAPQGVVDAFTIVAGYAFAFRCLPVHGAGTFTFAASDPLADIPHADPVRFTVAVNGKQRFAATLSPSERTNSDWTFYRVPLGTNERCIHIAVSASAPTGHATGSWVTLAAPAIHVQ